eukprot:2574062-Pyramimonas_sp.AAC.1
MFANAKDSSADPDGLVYSQWVRPGEAGLFSLSLVHSALFASLCVGEGFNNAHAVSLVKCEVPHD